MLFYNFQLGQDTVDEVMCLAGPDCPKAIVKPLGFVAVGFLCYGVLAYLAFTSCVAPAMSAARSAELL